MIATTRDFLTVGVLRIEYAQILQPDSTDTMVLLHEGLGSVDMWKDFPWRLASEINANVILYSRPGHGRSDKLASPRTNKYLHFEATEILPSVLRHFCIDSPYLFGHSDGASIALLYAATNNTRAIIAAAPHLFVEDVTLQGIRQADERSAATKQKLARYHNDADSLFDAWRDIWLNPDFRQWNIEDEVKKINCPVLAVQGREDQYGTLLQVERIKELVPASELLVLENCGHSPHLEQTDAVLLHCRDFLRRCRQGDEQRT